MRSAGEVWRAGKGGVVLQVRLTPKSSRDAIDGVAATARGPAVQARVRAVPEKGAANAALEALIAGWLGLPKRDVAVATGATSRLKSVRLTGDAEALGQRIEAALAAR